MSRKTIYSLFACLLCLLPVLIQAQSLTRYEYWFDDDFSGRVSKSLSGTDALVKLSIDTDQLDNGVHKFSFRVKQSDNMYSAITSSLFLKRPAAQNSVMEYWFDDKFDQRESMSISNTEDEQTFELDLRDNAKYPWGFHQLNMRITLEGGGESAIYSSPVLKLSAGKATQLEYWIDDDFAHVHTISGSLASDGQDYLFVNDLDLGDVSPGYHRLYCRAVSSSGKTASAVTMTPILVKSRYANLSPENVEITQVNLAIDNETPIDIPLSVPDYEVLVKKTIDASQLSVGTHQVKMKFVNSIGAGISDVSTFTVKKQEEPTLQFTAEQKNGLVNMQYNSIPNDVSYRIFRVDANGTRATVQAQKGGVFPSTICYTDNPPAGTYTYHAEAVYNGADGNRPRISSNEVSVTVPNTATDYGIVEGAVYYDSYRKQGIVSSIQFSDGVVVKTNQDGVFRRSRIPVGTELTASLVVNDEYMAQPVTFKVSKKSPSITNIKIEAISKFSFAVNDLDYGTLIFKRLEYMDGPCFKFTVKNASGKYWNGKIRIKSIAQKDDKHEDIDISIDPNNSQVLAGSVAPLSFIRTTTYQIFNSKETYHLANGEEKEIVLPLEGFKNDGPQQLFNFYFSSIAEDGTERLILPGRENSNVTQNPLAYEMEGNITDENKLGFLVNLIVYYCSTVKELDDRLGKIKKAFDEIKSVTGASLVYPSYSELTRKLERATTFDELYKDDALWNLNHIMYQESSRFSALTQSFRDKLRPMVSEAKSFLELTKGIRTAMKTINDLKASDAKSDCDKAFDFTEKVLDLTDSALGGIGFSKILKTYLDITRTAINAVKQLGWAYTQGELLLPSDFHDNRFEIDIKVLKKSGGAFNFKTKGTHIFDYVLVKGWNVNENTITTARCDDVSSEWFPGILTAKAIFKETSNDSNDPKADQQIKNLKNENFKRLWAEIYWKNGRVSYVPLNDLGEAVSYDRGVRSVFTITFQSEVDDYGHAADIIYLKE